MRTPARPPAPCWSPAGEDPNRPEQAPGARSTSSGTSMPGVSHGTPLPRRAPSAAWRRSGPTAPRRRSSRARTLPSGLSSWLLELPRPALARQEGFKQNAAGFFIGFSPPPAQGTPRALQLRSPAGRRSTHARPVQTDARRYLLNGASPGRLKAPKGGRRPGAKTPLARSATRARPVGITHRAARSFVSLGQGEAMAVWRSQREFAHSPRLVLGDLGHVGTGCPRAR